MFVPLGLHDRARRDNLWHARLVLSLYTTPESANYYGQVEVKPTGPYAFKQTPGTSRSTCPLALDI